MKAFAFQKNKRLKTNRQFRRVFQNKNRRGDKLLIIYSIPNGLDFARIGISIGKACGNAVCRNRVKRLIREAFRLNTDRVPVGFDYVVIANPKIKDNLEHSAKKLKLRDIERSLISLIKRVNKADSV